MSLRAAGVVATLAVALGTALLAAPALATGGGYGLGSLPATLPQLRLEFGISPLAVPFLATLALLSAAVAAWNSRRGTPGDAVWIAAFAAAMLAVLAARSVASFFLAWEAMTLISAVLVASHHEQRGVRRATFVYLAFAQAGALCILAALSLLALQAGSPSFAAIARAAPAMPPALRDAAFALALAGFGSKAGLMPLHFWLPRAHPVAPANASAMLSGAMLKVALYGLCVVAFELAAPATLSWGIALIVLGTASAIGGILYALIDRDLKRLLAYSSIENVGIITIGLGVALVGTSSANAALAATALTAALFHTLNHGLFKGLLFLGAGTVLEEEGTIDMERLGGLWRTLAGTAPLYLIGCVAISGLPPLNGFASEWMTFQSSIAGLHVPSVTARLSIAGSIAGLALAGGLAAACFVRVFGIVFLGRSRRSSPRAAAGPERFEGATLGLGILAASCAAFGLVPALAAVPFAHVAATITGADPLPLPALPTLPAVLFALPLACALAAVLFAAKRGIRRVPTWTCGSPVTAAAQYTATAFSKPLRTIFAFALFPERHLTQESGPSPWFPRRILYRTESRYLVDEFARRLSALVLRLSRRTRAVQSGSLRLYLAYAIAALVFTVAVMR